MSTEDLRGSKTRVDRSAPQAGVAQDPDGLLGRIHWWPALAVLPLLAVVVAAGPSTPEAGPVDAEVTSVESDAFPLVVNARVEPWIEAFRTTRSEEFESLLLRREIYAHIILEKLRQRGMPEELIYIPVIESGLSPFAVSRVSAVGLWQFMSPTAQQYGLRVDNWVDERRDPIAATDAALDYLNWLHHRFGGSWTLAAAAYNAGPGRVERVLHRHAEGWLGGEELFWEIREHLPRETREYVPKLIAITRLAKDADADGFDGSGVEPYRFENVFVPGGTSLDRVAATLELDVEILRALNPHLVRGITPPDEAFPLRVPIGHGNEVVDSLAGGRIVTLTDDD